MSKEISSYTSKEAANIVGVSIHLIHKWCKEGKYPGAEQITEANWKIPKHYFEASFDQPQKDELEYFKNNELDNK